MKNLFIITLFLVIFPVPVQAQKSIRLFNGKNLSGWYAWEPASGKHANAAELFSVDHKTIRLYGKKAGYLMSEQSFHNFRLSAEFRWNTDAAFAKISKTKNSGIMYLIPDNVPDVLWPKGIQYQIKEGATGDFILLQEVTLVVNGIRTEPGKSVTSKRIADAWKPDGEWNKMVITCRKGHIIQELNGKPVNEGTDPTVSEGRILLQYEGYPIDFRKIVIKRLE